MKGSIIITIVICILALSAQGQAPVPRRSYIPAMGERDIQRAIASYRKMWERMSPARRQAMVDQGGYTPERYEEMMRSMAKNSQVWNDLANAAGRTFTETDVERYAREYGELMKVSTPATMQSPLSSDPDQLKAMIRAMIEQSGGKVLSGPLTPVPLTNEPSKPSNINALATMRSSNEDLNALRDTNVGLIKKTGCPPEVTMRIAELRAKLGGDKVRSAGSEQGDLATNWYKRDAPAVAESRDREKDRDLDSVLNLRVPSSAKTDSSDKQKLETELQQLIGVCAEAR